MEQSYFEEDDLNTCLPIQFLAFRISQIPPSMWPSRKNSCYGGACTYTPLISCVKFEREMLGFDDLLSDHLLVYYCFVD